MGKAIELISQEDFEATKEAMRSIGMIPKRGLVVKCYKDFNLEIDDITLSQIDHLCVEDIKLYHDLELLEYQKRRKRLNQVRASVLALQSSILAATDGEPRY